MTHAEERAYRRQNVVQDLARRGMTLTQYAAAYNDGAIDRQAGIARLSPATLYRWRRAYADLGVEGLAPRYNTPTGGGARTLTKHDKELIQSYYLDDRRPTLAHVLRLIQRYHGVEIAYATARRYINGLPRAVHILKREGAKAYNDKAAPFIRRAYDMDVMQIVSADHHILDLLCRHPQKGTPFRPWVTMITDYRSRKPLGWHISTAPNRYTILTALQACVQTYGVPSEIHIDNGKDFRSKLLNGEIVTVKNPDPFGAAQTIEMQGVFGRLGVQVHFATPYRAQAKPVERFFRFVAEDFSKQFPSYVGSNTTDKPADVARYYGRVNGQERRGDLLDFGDVAALLGLWVTRYSAEHRHTGDGMEGRTPDQVFAGESITPRPVMPPEFRDLVFCDQFTPTVGRAGVRIENVKYYSPDLVAYLGQQVVARRPFRDHATVILFDTGGRRLCTAYAHSLDDAGDARANSHKRLAAGRAARQRLAEYLERPVQTRSIVDELDEARKVAGLDDNVIDMAARRPEPKPNESNVSDFFKGV